VDAVAVEDIPVHEPEPSNYFDAAALQHGDQDYIEEAAG
jgi:hypothetical protein